LIITATLEGIIAYFIYGDDPDDETVLELAVHGGCDVMVTYNKKDFKNVDMFGIKVQTSAVF
jgi:predicted nucleic acid-binding protein